MMRLSFSAALLAAAACVLPSAAQTAAVATPANANVNIGTALNITVYLTPKNAAAAESKARSLQTPGSSDYHQFLTLAEFVQNYAPSNADIAAIESLLVAEGYTIKYVYPNHLAIETFAPPITVENSLGIKLQRASRNGVTGFAPDRPITIPAALQGKIRAIGGLNTVNHPHPMLKAATFAGSSQAQPRNIPNPLVGGTPGNYLPADFASFYDLDPLYNQGFTGRGKTIGIVTLANFSTADAFTFWKNIGLAVDPNRITKINVDSGFNSSKGEGETDIDVEYSGALAPEANLRVYVAPNGTNSGFINGFEAAASENIADTVSTSWGEAEANYFATPGVTGIVSPVIVGNGSSTAELDAFHDVFLEMALQGQTIFAASGDSGAFDTVEECSPFGEPSPKSPVCNVPYAADHPAVDPLVTAAGGTTRPFTLDFGNGLSLSVSKERAWSWDYILSEGQAQGFNFTLADFFSVGDGGGVSSYFPLPWYQVGVPGMTKTKPGQTWIYNFGSGNVTYAILKSNFAGRNSPDLSADADPYSGYQFISQGKLLNFYGGTSFIAPELNGVTALLNQGLGGRVGQLNPALYKLQYVVTPDVAAGDNWGYNAIFGFDNAAGIGKLDAAKLFKGLQSLEQTK